MTEPAACMYDGPHREFPRAARSTTIGDLVFTGVIGAAMTALYIGMVWFVNATPAIAALFK